MAKGWQREFDEPIELPSGRRLVTLHDAATYITSLPKNGSGLPEWQAAIEALMLVVRQPADAILRDGQAAFANALKNPSAHASSLATVTPIHRRQ